MGKSRRSRTGWSVFCSGLFLGWDSASATHLGGRWCAPTNSALFFVCFCVTNLAFLYYLWYKCNRTVHFCVTNITGMEVNDMRLNEVVHLRLTRADMDFLRELSAELGLSVSAIVRCIIGSYRRSMDDCGRS